MPPKKTYAKGGGKSKRPPAVKQSSKSKKRKARHSSSSESGSDSEPEVQRHRAKRDRPSDKPTAPKAGGKAKHPPKGKRVTRKDEQSDDTEEDDDSDSDDSTEEGDEKSPPDTPPSQDMDMNLSTLVSSTQTTAMKERRVKRMKAWEALQMKAVDDGFTLADMRTSKDRKIKDQIKEVIESCRAEVEESKQAWKGAMRAIDQKTNGVNEMTESLNASCKDGRGPMLAVLHAAIEDAKGYDARVSAVVVKAESMRDADIRSMTDAVAKRDDAGAFISRLRNLVKMAK